MRCHRVSGLSDEFILDDWGLASLSGQPRHDLLEVLDDCYARHGTLLASQIRGEDRHESGVTTAPHRYRHPPAIVRTHSGRLVHAAARTGPIRNTNS